jgi:ATP-dependent Clp protease ATP-binding subunit ClpA
MAEEMNSLTDWERLRVMLGNAGSGSKTLKIDEKAMLEHLQSRVKGQDNILRDVARLIRLQAAKQEKDRPICNLLFLGATGTGKTELAKAIGSYLFEDEKAIIRFDCSELTAPESKSRLIGHPIGYVGSEQGGQLTRPVMANGRRVILFDEIEKAYPPVFDLFLQMMGEGRLTEQGSGKTVDYSQCIIILTSNANADEIGKIQRETSDYHEMVNAVKGHLAESKVFRPEILGRIDRVYVFQPLEGMVIAEIAVMKISKLAQQYGLKVQFVAPELLVRALIANEKVSRWGIRELDRILNDMLSNDMLDAREAGAKTVRVEGDLSGNVRVTAVDA